MFFGFTNVFIEKLFSPYSFKNNNIDIEEFIKILKNIELIKENTEIRNISIDENAEKIMKNFFKGFYEKNNRNESNEIKPKTIKNYLREIMSIQYVVLKKYYEIIELVTKYNKELDIKNKHLNLFLNHFLELKNSKYIKKQ